MVRLTVDVPGSGVEFDLMLDNTQLSQSIIVASCLGQGNVYDKQETQLMVDIVPVGGTVFDVGAHVGWFTMLCGKLVGHRGRVFAFEPNLANRERLMENIEINRCRDVFAVDSVVSDVDGTVQFYTNFDNDGGHALWNPKHHEFNQRSREHEHSELLHSVTIDGFCAERSISTIDVLKIDTEGAEVKVLRGAEKMLSSHSISHIIAEVNDLGLELLGTSRMEMLTLMESHGYRCKGLFGNWKEGDIFNIHFYLG